jgi:hypothetical protein
VCSHIEATGLVLAAPAILLPRLPCGVDQTLFDCFCAFECIWEAGLVASSELRASCAFSSDYGTTFYFR